MTTQICLRCDWHGEATEPTCPDCGVPLYVVGAVQSGAEIPPPVHDGLWNPLPPPALTVRSSGRSARSSAMFLLLALASAVAFGTWLNEREERSAPAPPAAPSPTGTDGSMSELRRALRYVAKADAICTAASASFATIAMEFLGPELEDDVAWSQAAARASDEALLELRALHPPEDSAVFEFLSLMYRQTGVLHQVVEAASAGDIPRLQRLSGERIRRTHLKDGLAFALAKKWGVSPARLQGCPVSLPA
jgi:hypothetical protein